VPARISVVVPVFNVAPYLHTCLRSLAQQSVGDDLDVVVVDDGSTDGSREIAEKFAARDRRFMVVSQANAGLGAARNAGIEHASGEYIAFVDSDDAVPRHAYETLVGSLSNTGSDIASGNVRRFTHFGTSQAAFLAKTFERTRLRTHVTRFPLLIADRTAWNKVFRRSFWDKHAFRFPEGVLYEDIPVTLPAHFLAESVDVVSETVYLWRVRSGTDRSITQRRTEPRAIRDRVAAVDHVSRFLAECDLTSHKRRYDSSVLGDDLHPFLLEFDRGEDEYRARFLELINDFLDRADPQILDRPLAIDRLMWHLVRRHASSELLEVLRFLADDLPETLPVRQGRRWFGDYPFRTDPRLAIPAHVYELDAELALEARVTDVRWEESGLVVEGYAFIHQLGAPERRSQRVDVVIRRPGSWLPPRRVRVEPVFRPDVTAASDGVVGLDWSGFRATIATGVLRRRVRQGFEIGIVVSSGGVTRRTWSPEPAPCHPFPSAEAPLDGVTVRVGLNPAGKLTVRAKQRRATVRSFGIAGEGVLQLEGELGVLGEAGLVLRVSRRVGIAKLEYPVHVDRDEQSFLARLPLADLLGEIDVADQSAHAEQSDGIDWDLYLAGREGQERLALHEETEELAWSHGDREIAVHRTRYGNVTLVERAFRPVIANAQWQVGGALAIGGYFRGPGRNYDVVLSARHGSERYTVSSLHRTGADRFSFRFRPGKLVSLAGPHQLGAGEWEFLVVARDPPRTEIVRAVVDHGLLSKLPARTTIGRKTFEFGLLGYETPVLCVGRDLDDEEGGGARQRRLRTSFYRTHRAEPLEDVILYESFQGRSYSDSPRAIHEELIRRGAPFEHRWVVRDGAFRVPESAVAIRELSKDHYESLARARYVVTNDFWPKWAERRADQAWIQTWHGLPIKRYGHELDRYPMAVRAHRQALQQRPDNWQFVVSPCSFATRVFERSFPATQILEVGLPRTDRLLSPDPVQKSAEIKQRLGLDEARRVVLYAPTYRDSLPYREGYRLGPLLDLARVHTAVGEEATLLFRRHRHAIGRLPDEVEGLVLDVSEYPESTDLLLAADVLVTDYSSLLADFVSTGKPVVLYTPDLDVYRDKVRGLSIDLEAEAPGPLLHVVDDVIDALRDPDPVLASYRDRYDSFATRYCGLNDGKAAGRVVDSVFGQGTG
jgi:CDP-glycerol glycerophosphotransferase